MKFTSAELFPAPGIDLQDVRDSTTVTLYPCTECSAVVTSTSVHTEWHNKVADL